MTLDEAKSGSLLFRTDQPGQYIPAPALATDVQIKVTGPIIRTRLTQKFINNSAQTVEGIYLFPLPQDAAVDRLVMIIGGRVIEGKIQEKRQARKTYDTAKEAGRKASLVEQIRPNMFTNSVANIGPKETITVQIEYQGTAKLRDGRYSLHFPLIVAPRFNPNAEQSPTFENQVPRITDPAQIPKGVRLQVQLTAGFDLDDINSPSHKISISGDRQKSITIDGPVPADRDFILNWIPKVQSKPAAQLFTEQKNGSTYLLGLIQAPTGMGEQTFNLPREAVFVIDNSGSMAGKSIRQARTALLLALDGLRASDRFNVIAFENVTDKLFTQSVVANRENLATAKRFVSRLNGDGGTVMLPALRAAFRTTAPARENQVRQVIFITDGQISNEGELFAEIRRELGQSRLFMIGIGAAPNRYFLSRAARLGRGTNVTISDINQVEQKMTEMLMKLERPVMQNLTVSFPGATQPIIWPNPLPDLYANDPVVIVAKIDEAPQNLLVSGQFSHAKWQANLDLSSANSGTGISQLWARAKIASLEESRFDGIHPSHIDAQILQTALAHHLVSRVTSLVAVDVTPQKMFEAEAVTQVLPLALPDGWSPLKVKPRTTSITPPSLNPVNDTGITLPATASPHEIKLILGLLSLALALALFGRWLPARSKS